MSSDEPYVPHPKRYDYIDEKTGHAIRRDKIVHPEYGVLEAEVDLTEMYRTAARRTSSVSVLVIEAELADAGGEVGNPAVPVNERVESEAVKILEERGLEPAWRHHE